MKQWWKWKEFWEMAFWVPSVIIACSFELRKDDGIVAVLVVGATGFVILGSTCVFYRVWVKDEETEKEGGKQP